MSAAPGEQYVPLLNHQYEVPSSWSQVNTGSSIVVVDSSEKVTIEIAEMEVEPWLFPTVLALGDQLVPGIPSDWSEWELESSGSIKGGNAYEFQFSGTKHGVPYVSFVHWFMYGDVHIQLTADIPEFDWSASSEIRSNVRQVLDSFEPNDGHRLFTEERVMELLALRLDDRASGIYARNEEIRARYELTCGQILTDLPFQLAHLGDGLWQLTAQGLEGLESFRIFEPRGSIDAFTSNYSIC